MSFLFRAIIALLGGLFAAAFMIGSDHGKAAYLVSSDLRFVPRPTADSYWGRASQENPALKNVTDSTTARREVLNLFRADLKQMKWTWDRELYWKTPLGGNSAYNNFPTKTPQ